MTHISEEDLILLYYKEPCVPAALRAHLRECGDCTVRAQALAAALNVCNEWTVPDPGPEFGRGVWARIAPRMVDARRPRFLWLKIAGAVTAMAALLLTAFVAGQASRHPRLASPMAGLSRQARERILAISLTDHLDRAEMLLTEFSNAGDSDAAELSGEVGRAQDLVEEGRLLRQSLALHGDSSTLSLLDEVERFMLEVANSPGTLTAADVRQLRARIGAGSLLFKVRIIESNLRTQGQKI
ncbi:MAG TPA: hypothetical protein VFC21_09200 [Bryobacteraceae bacterium]|nr:hypothetical protein [Bryobacteraceae bacterium]